MYLSHIQHTQPPLPIAIEQALHYLRTTDFSTLPAGRHPIQGEKMIAIVQSPQTQPWETGMPEFHQRYIDIQYLLEGEEVIGYHIAQTDLALATDQLVERDIAFVHPVPLESKLILSPGMFAIFYPGELHKPCRSLAASQVIKKIVIKIDHTLLAQT